METQIRKVSISWKNTALFIATPNVTPILYSVPFVSPVQNTQIRYSG